MPHHDPSSSIAPASARSLPTVVLVHYGTPDLTRRCLACLAATETEPHRVVVVDHGPGPGLGDALAGVHPHCTVLVNLANPGFGAGCNLGAAFAFAEGAQEVWFLNNDATLEGPTFGRLLALAREHPEIALWGTRQRDGKRFFDTDLQPDWFTRRPGAPPSVLPPGCRQLEGRETLSGASILVTRRQWDRLGPWPEDMFLYQEDVAWCLRAHALCLPMALTDLSVVHPRSSTIGRHSPLSIFYGVRNQLLLHRQIHPGAGAARFGMTLHMLQKRFFQGRWGLLPHTLRGILASARGQVGRDSRY